jgi:ssDNA-binding Zn-finger/Zn-ribbon topoisomerase 1
MPKIKICPQCGKKLPLIPVKAGKTKVCGNEECIRRALREEDRPNKAL